MSVSQIIPININKTNISPRRIIHTHGKHSRRSTLEVKVVRARRLHRCRLQQPAALHPGLVDIIVLDHQPTGHVTRGMRIAQSTFWLWKTCLCM